MQQHNHKLEFKCLLDFAFFGIKRKCGAISFHCEQFISDFDDIDIKISLVIIIDRINGTFEIIL